MTFVGAQCVVRPWIHVLHQCLVVWQSRVRCLGVACGVQKIGFFGRYVAQYLARQRIHVKLQFTWLLDELEKCAQSVLELAVP